MCGETGPDKGGLTEVVSTVDVSTVGDESINDLLAGEASGDVEGGMALVIEHGVNIERDGRGVGVAAEVVGRGDFAEEIEHRYGVVALAYSSDDG